MYIQICPFPNKPSFATKTKAKLRRRPMREHSRISCWQRRRCRCRCRCPRWRRAKRTQESSNAIAFRKRALAGKSIRTTSRTYSATESYAACIDYTNVWTWLAQTHTRRKVGPIRGRTARLVVREHSRSCRTLRQADRRGSNVHKHIRIYFISYIRIRT